jgi:trigger factor
LDISLDKTTENEGIIKITLNKADYQPAVDQKIKEYSKKANIKGFRPGKVPPGLIRSMYGKSLLVEEINQLVSRKLSTYLQESSEQFLGEPMPNEEQMKEIDWDNQEDFIFEYRVGFAGAFELNIDKKVKIDYHTIKIDDAVIDETIENLQRQFGEPSDADEIEEKDFIFVKVQDNDDKLDKEIRLDARELEKSALKKFKGGKIGDEVSLEAKKLYKSVNLLQNQLGLTDEEYKQLKGKLSFKVQAIQRIQEMEVGQNLFDKTFGEGKVNALEDFRDKVKTEVSKNYKNEEEQFFQYKLREQLIDKAGISLPDAFLKDWLLATNENMTEDLLDKEYDSYAKELRWSLIRNRIVKDQSFHIEHEEVQEEAKNLIRNQLAASGMADGLGDQLDAFANNYLQGENGDNYMKASRLTSFSFIVISSFRKSITFLCWTWLCTFI